MIQLRSKIFSIDAIGFGTYLISPGDVAYRAVTEAIEEGYSSIDTARYYNNEQDVGRAVRNAGVDKKIHITTKLWYTDHGYDKALEEGRRSRDYLGVESIDLFLIHWPGDGDGFIDTWRAFEKLISEGTVKNIGVSNFTPKHLKILKDRGLSTPVVNQIEMSPLRIQKETRMYCNKHEIIVEAWGPIARGNIIELQLLEPIARRHNKTIAQVALRWAVQKGCRILPKSVRRERMRENINIFDFELTFDELEKIDMMNKEDS